MKKSLVLGILSLSSCDFVDRKLKVINETSTDVVVEVAEKKIFYTEGLLDYYLNDLSGRDHVICPFEKDTLSTFNNHWEDLIENSYNKKLNLYVFELDSALKYKGLNEAYKHGAYLKKIELTKGELEARNWVVEIR